MNTMAFLLSFWDINSLIYVRLVPFIDTIKYVVTTKNVSVKMCLAVLHIENTMTFINTSVITIQDLIFLMSWSRGYIVVFLYRHRKITEHLHSNNFSSRASHEIKAIRTVSLLMIFSMVFYLSNSCYSLYLSTVKKKNELLENILNMFSSCYPVLCLFLLIGRESHIQSPNYLYEVQKVISSQRHVKANFHLDSSSKPNFLGRVGIQKKS